MTQQESRATAEIRELVDRWADAIRAKDTDALMSHYAPDILSFDLAPPLQYRGADLYRRSIGEWFSTFRGPVGYEIRELSITVDEDVAFCHSLNRIGGTRTDREETDVWVRATMCLRRIGGRWRITHEHLSVPFDMETLQASLDLKP